VSIRAAVEKRRKSNRLAMVAATRRRDRAYAALFAAGWKPVMAYAPAEPEYHELLLALNDANTAVSRQAMKRVRHS
jgi:hypothetical protein